MAIGWIDQDMADRKVLAHDRNLAVARTFYESALADYDHAVVLDPQVGGDVSRRTATAAL